MMNTKIRTFPRCVGFSWPRLRTALLCLLTTLVAYVYWIAAVIQVDYSDSYHLLLNARTISEGKGPYNFHRFIAASLMHVPSFWLEKLTGVEGLAVRLSHLLGATSYSLLLYVLYRLYRLASDESFALLAVLLFAGTPLVIHYAPTAKEDLPAVLVATLALFFYLTAKSNRDLLLCGVFIGTAMAIRYNLIPVLFLVIALNELFLRGAWRTLFTQQTFTRAGLLCLWPLTVFFLFPLLIYPWIGHSGFFTAIPQFVEELFYQYDTNNRAWKTPFLNFSFLIRMVGLPMLFLAALGVVHALRSRIKHSGFFLLWGSLVFFYQTYFVAGKELRYLFLCLPSCSFFAVQGIHGVFELLKSKKALASALTLLVLALPLREAIRECLKFQDPFYRVPFARKVSLKAEELARSKNGRFVWVGPYYGTHPRSYYYHPDDDFAYIYHVYSHAVYFFTRRDVLKVEGGKLAWKGSWEKGVWLPGIGPRLRDGDVLFINAETRVSATSTIEKFHQPLLLQRARLRELPVKDLVSWREWVPSGDYELYLQSTANEEPISQGRVTLEKGLWRGYFPDSSSGLQRAFLLSFEEPQVFWNSSEFSY